MIQHLSSSTQGYTYRVCVVMNLVMSHQHTVLYITRYGHLHYMLAGLLHTIIGRSGATDWDANMEIID